MRAAFDLFKGLANVAMTLAFFYFCGWWLFVGWPAHTRATEDPVYAADLFEGLVLVEKILETRKYHGRDAEPWDCTYAIARLTEDAPLTPPTRAYDNPLGWQYEFGGDWLPTPAAPLRDTTRNAVAFCAQYWPVALGREIETALAGPGAWYSRDAVGETVYLYAPKQRLAARIRFGD